MVLKAKKRTGMINRTAALVGGSVVFGLIVLLILIQFSPSEANGKRADESTTPVYAPPMGTPVPRNASGDSTGIGGMASEGGTLEFEDVRITYVRLEPLAQGWHRVDGVEARVKLNETDMVIVRADHASIHTIESNRIESGELTGHVIMELYRLDRPRDVDLGIDLPQAIIKTDSIAFNRVLNKVETDDRLVVRTPEVALAGTGFKLVFNEKENRIEYLAFENIEQILYHQEKTAPVANVPAPSAAEPAMDALSTNTPTSTPPANETAKAPRFYELTLDGDIQITRGIGDGALLVRGSTIRSFFAMDSDSIQPTKESGKAPIGWINTWARRVSDSPRTASIAWKMRHPAELMLNSAMAMEVEPLYLLGREGVPREAEDILIEGPARMEMRPLAGRPVELVSDTDQFLEITGEPVTIEVSSYETKCRTVDFHKSNGQLRLLPGRDQELVITSPEVGAISTFEALVIYTEEERAEFTGAGRIIGLQDEAKRNRLRGESTPMHGLPAGFSLTWSRQCQLQFSSEGGQGNLGDISGVYFEGDVRVNDPKGYEVQSQTLGLNFTYSPKHQRNVLESIVAKEQAFIESPEGRAQADEFFVRFMTDANGDPVAEMADATGNVIASNTSQTLNCEFMQLTFANSKVAKEVGGESDDGGDIDITWILAQGRVHLNMIYENRPGVETDVYADRLEAHPAEQRASLTGESVFVRHDTFNMETRRIDIFQENGGVSAFVPSAGVLTLHSMPARSPDAVPRRDRLDTIDEVKDELRRRLQGMGRPIPDDWKAPESAGESVTSLDVTDDNADADEVDKAKIIRVTWHDSLSYDESKDGSTIEFKGEVLAESSATSVQYDTLAAQTLTFELSPPQKTESGSTPATTQLVDGHDRSIEGTPVKPDGFDFNDANAQRSLRSLTAVGTKEKPARIESVRYADENQDEHEILFALTSQILEYVTGTERLEGIGGGWFLVDDRRRETGDHPQPRDPNEANPLMGISGHGETYFSWTGRMILDGGKGILGIRDDVVMRHRPTGEDVVHMSCDSLAATIEAPDGVQAFGLAGRDGMDLRKVVCDGSVFVSTRDMEIEAANMTYSEKSKQAILSGTDWTPVTVLHDDDPVNPLHARRIIWDLYDDSFRAIGPSW